MPWRVSFELRMYGHLRIDARREILCSGNAAAESGCHNKRGKERDMPTTTISAVTRSNTSRQPR